MASDMVLTVPMVVTDFDEEVAAANGYEIIELADGTRASVPVDRLSTNLDDLGVENYNTVAGNCGTSTVYMHDDGTGRAYVGTGFRLTRGAISYSWSVTVAGIQGTYTKKFGGGLLNRKEWTGSFTWTVPGSGWYTSTVSPSSSVTLNNGSVCSSGSPTDSVYVQRW